MMIPNANHSSDPAGLLQRYSENCRNLAIQLDVVSKSAETMKSTIQLHEGHNRAMADAHREIAWYRAAALIAAGAAGWGWALVIWW